MKIICPSCAAQYAVPDAAAAKLKHMRCARCATEWVLGGDDLGSMTITAAVASPSPQHEAAEAPPARQESATATSPPVEPKTRQAPEQPVPKAAPPPVEAVLAASGVTAQALPGTMQRRPDVLPPKTTAGLYLAVAAALVLVVAGGYFYRTVLTGGRHDVPAVPPLSATAPPKAASVLLPFVPVTAPPKQMPLILPSMRWPLPAPPKQKAPVPAVGSPTMPPTTQLVAPAVPKSVTPLAAVTEKQAPAMPAMTASVPKEAVPPPKTAPQAVPAKPVVKSIKPPILPAAAAALAAKQMPKQVAKPVITPLPARPAATLETAAPAALPAPMVKPAAAQEESRSFVPVPVSGGAPEYPSEYADDGRTGQVLVSCMIEADGMPNDCHATSLEGGNAFSVSVLQWLGSGRVRYRPALRGGQPVARLEHWNMTINPR
jgi:predicted Zn finger-like uncharacterized protein